MRYFVILCFVFLLIIPVYPQEEFENPRYNPGLKVYLPGDVVHVVVGAPIDTTQVIAAMPDGERIKLSFERRTYTWHSHWEIPYGFKKGTYHAKLTATDIEGKIFEGETQPFYVGELALVTLIGLGPTTEVELTEKLVKIPTAEASVLKEPVVGSKVEPGKKVVPLKKSVAKPKGPVSLVHFLPVVRQYIAGQEYEKARAQLLAIFRTYPDSMEIKTMLSRLDMVIKAKKRKL